jgi:hypothetical protein
MATIITKNSQTASAVPAAASLSVGELAVNTADGKLYTEHTGGVVKEIIPSTVVDGGITAAKIASNAVVEAKIADGAVTTAKLSNSGVTAGTYTTATVTVDAKGRITSATSGSGGGVTSLNGQTGAITNTSVDAIGSYIWCYYSATTPSPPFSSYINTNTTVSGSILRYISNVSSITTAQRSNYAGQNPVPWNLGGTALSGTWRAMSVNEIGASYNSCTDYSRGTWHPSLWVRIS